VDCKGRRSNGSCVCAEELKDLVDMIWEAKAGRLERLDALIAKANAGEERYGSIDDTAREAVVHDTRSP
jgi:hypothetical protein